MALVSSGLFYQHAFSLLLIKKKIKTSNGLETGNYRRGKKLQTRSNKNNKAPGHDAIPAELPKAKGLTAINKLLVLLTKIWNEELISENWIKCLIVKIPQKRRYYSVRLGVSNWCGNTLLPGTSKILGKIIK